MARKARPTGLVNAELTFNGEAIGSIPCSGKAFSTGSQGFYGQGKLFIGGQKHQTMVTLVLTHSKPGDDKTPGS